MGPFAVKWYDYRMVICQQLKNTILQFSQIQKYSHRNYLMMFYLPTELGDLLWNLMMVWLHDEWNFFHSRAPRYTWKIMNEIKMRTQWRGKKKNTTYEPTFLLAANYPKFMQFRLFECRFHRKDRQKEKKECWREKENFRPVFVH